MIKGVQIWQARRLLRWSVETLAQRSGKSVLVVDRAEAGFSQMQRASLTAIQSALEAGGIEFTNEGEPGVRMKKAVE